MFGGNSGESLWGGIKTRPVARAHLGKKSGRLRLELVGHPRTCQALGGNVRGQVKPNRQVRLTHHIALRQCHGLHQPLQKRQLFQIETGDDPENDAAQQAALAKSHETYRDVALKAIELQESVEDLNEWWKGEAANRNKLGITNTTEVYKVLTTAAADRSNKLKGK